MGMFGHHGRGGSRTRSVNDNAIVAKVLGSVEARVRTSRNGPCHRCRTRARSRIRRNGNVSRTSFFGNFQTKGWVFPQTRVLARWPGRRGRSRYDAWRYGHCVHRTGESCKDAKLALLPHEIPTERRSVRTDDSNKVNWKLDSRGWSRLCFSDGV